MDLKETLFQNHPIANTPTVYAWISAILPTAYVIAGVILFLYTVFGGFLIISSGSDPKAADSGKQVITNAIIGFVILFASYWLIQIIEVLTGIPILNPSLT
jgi:hypothetical protein